MMVISVTCSPHAVLEGVAGRLTDATDGVDIGVIEPALGPANSVRLGQHSATSAPFRFVKAHPEERRPAGCPNTCAITHTRHSRRLQIRAPGFRSRTRAGAYGRPEGRSAMRRDVVARRCQGGLDGAQDRAICNEQRGPSARWRPGPAIGDDRVGQEHARCGPDPSSHRRCVARLPPQAGPATNETVSSPKQGRSSGPPRTRERRPPMERESDRSFNCCGRRLRPARQRPTAAPAPDGTLLSGGSDPRAAREGRPVRPGWASAASAFPE
jgi:hypothetical protein